MNRSRSASAYWLGRVPYRHAWDLQRRIVEEVRSGARGDTLLLLEHPPVFTLGRQGSLDHVLWDEIERERRGIDLVWCDRGGDVTHHAPGQLVGYPILDLSRHGSDVVAFVRRLEASIIAYLAALDIEAGAEAGYTGVWSGGAKVAAIGIRLSGGVVSHGLALNLDPDLDGFTGIVPCGIAGRPVTSVARLRGVAPTVAEAAAAYARHFASEFDCEVETAPAAGLPWPMLLEGIAVEVAP